VTAMEGPSLATGVFYLLAVLAVLGAGGVAFSQNIVYSALSLMLSFLGVAGLYVFLDAEFVAGIQVLIYVGGVLVLTLFAVMLTQGISDVEVSNASFSRPIGLIVVVAAFLVLFRSFLAASWFAGERSAMDSSTYGVGNALLGPYVLPFEVASVVLLTVLIGAVVLSRKEVGEGGRPDERAG
jgi:NAD(P)H-quinone oxidoreductase subunit 6